MKRLRHAGTVTSITQHHSHPDMIRVSVAHGPKKRGKKGEMVSYDDRPTSELSLPKEHASRFKLGMRVNVGAGGSDTDEPDADDAAPYRQTVRNIIAGKKS